MTISGRANASLKQGALALGLGVAVLIVALAALGFLVAGFYIWISRKTDAASAAAITGGVLLVIAFLIGGFGRMVLRRLKKSQPGWLSEFGGTIGLAGRLVGLMVRKDPRKAVILAAIAGALAEYITGDNKKT